MKKMIQQILDLFDNAYGGDVLIGERDNQYLHFSYDEIKILLKKLKKYDCFKVVWSEDGLGLVKVKKHQREKGDVVITVSELFNLLLKSKRPRDVSSREEIYYFHLPCEGDNRKIDDKNEKRKTIKKKSSIRFDWHDHYLEGLRIHGNIDDAEAHADEMKRKLLDKI
ncbi:MAG: hypothetical protein ACVCEJ_09990 [Candidatus Izemoplasmataceae bacterium]